MAEYELSLPVNEEKIKLLKVRDVFYFTGEIYTIRDMAYDRILSTINSGGVLPFDLNGKAIWHCGPITRPEGGGWKPVSVGSTTSSRFTGPASRLIEELGVKLIVGKGRMGQEASGALSRHQAAYAITTGGTAAYYANQVEEIKAVHWLDLGMPSAVWVLKVNKFGPLIVAIDSHGGNLFEEMMLKVDAAINHIYRDFEIDPTHNYIWWP